MKKLVLGLLVFCYTLVGCNQNTTISNLKTEYQTTPLGMDIKKPRFSWQMEVVNNAKGLHQEAYQIIVTDEKGNTVWDTEKVDSDISYGIAYAGSPLEPTTKYDWQLTVWNNKGEEISSFSWFETGLMNPDISAWDGAKWIGGGDEDLVFYPHYLSVFKFQYDIQLDAESKSTKAAFLFGGNDSRLTNANLNLMGMANAKNESYVAFELDISDLEKSSRGTAKLNIYRAGYTKTDSSNIPLKTLEIPRKLINQSNKYAKHTISAECNFGLFVIYLDGNKKENILGEKDAPAASIYDFAGINLNPLGSGNNYISFPMLADIGFKVNEGQKATFSEVEVKNFRLPSNTLFKENLSTKKSIFKSENITIENGNYVVNGGEVILADPSQNGAPMLRTGFDLEKKEIAKARLYVTARGIYEMYLNGQKVSNDYFNPGLTQYNKTQMYQTYDLTQKLNSGQTNVLGAWLSEGWWSGNITYSGENWNYFGDRQSLLSKLVVTYKDGTQQTVVSSPESWQFFNEGPVVYGSFFQGEVYDATKEAAVEGWSTGAYDSSNWKAAVEVPLDGTAYQEDFADFFGNQYSLNYDNQQLVGQLGDNASIVKVMPAISVEEVRPKVFVYDMGQNMVGFPQINMKGGSEGQVVGMRYSEVKYPDLKEYEGNEGMVMMENIRAALTQDKYILKGGNETIQPRFTFHGYRYLEITGIDAAIPVADVKGMVISSVDKLASSYTTSNEKVNKLWENITWSLRSNFLSIPTDTPARNERMGWSGDISVFARTATYLTDADLFLRRHLLNMRDVQFETGRFTDVAPMGGGFGGTLWGSAGIVVAWETYRQYGDIELLKEHYPAMKKYLAFLDTKINSQGILNEGPLGDWLSPEGNKNDNTLFWMSYYAYDLDIVAKMAKALGQNKEAVKYQNRSAQIKAKFNEVYVDAETHRTIRSGVKTMFIGPPNEAEKVGKLAKGDLIDTQASYAIPLALGTFNEANKPFAVQYLTESIQRKNMDDQGRELPEYSLMTGFIGTASIMEALAENEKDKEAYALLQQESYPSWLYSVVNGATSIWERLNSYTVEDGFGGNNSMNSFNHYSFGSVAAWMYNYSLGIQRDPEVTGFKSFVLKPTPDPSGKMTHASGYYDSVYGRIKSAWELADGKWYYKATVPPNTTAKLYLPATTAELITESGQNINNHTKEGKYIVIHLESGDYAFEITQH